MNPKKPVSRRALLGSAGVLSSALILARVAESAPEAASSLVVKLSDDPELGKVGGWKVFDLGDDSVIVANTGKGLVARSAVCPHRGCKVEYHGEAHEFVCPCHKSQFDEDGHVTHGPARTGLAPYGCAPAIVVSKEGAAAPQPKVSTQPGAVPF